MWEVVQRHIKVAPQSRQEVLFSSILSNFGKVEVILVVCRSATGFGLFPALLFCLWLSGSIVHGWPEIHSSPISLVDLSGGLLRNASSGERNTMFVMYAND